MSTGELMFVLWPGEEVVISVDEWVMDYVAEEQEC